jgi:single-stranded-DNA-specific exonuclease
VRFLLTADDGARLKGIAFRAAGTPLGQLLLGAEGPLHFAGTLGVDIWQGRETVQFRVLDVALPDAR